MSDEASVVINLNMYKFGLVRSHSTESTARAPVFIDLAHELFGGGGRVQLLSPPNYKFLSD
jgi:hypothetical protein